MHYKTHLRTLLALLLFLLATSFGFAANEIRTVGASGADYLTLKSAFDAINSGFLTGNVTLRIVDSTTETETAVLFASGTGASNYNSVTIYPTASNISIQGNLSAPLIDFNGADQILIDGRLNATGQGQSLTIANASTSSNVTCSTIRFINGASNNQIVNCRLQGTQRNAKSGVVFFSSSTATGNSNNMLSNNEITSFTNIDRPVNMIYSEGSPTSINSDNTISGNQIFDFMNRSLASNAIHIAANSSNFEIDNNSFFETTSFTPTHPVNYSVIFVNNTAAESFKIQNNFIGGSAALASGSPFVKTGGINNSFTGIYLSVGNVTATSVQNNTITNFNWTNTNSGSWVGIMAQAGVIDIGTASGNTIGQGVGTDAIQYSLSSTSGFLFPIQINSSDLVRCFNNQIGSITALNVNRMSGIFKNSVSGNTEINQNVIGSKQTQNSIQVVSNQSTPTQFLIAIQVQGFDTNIVTDNTVSNLICTSTAGGYVRGIEVLSGTNVLSRNTISKISTAISTAISISGISISNGSFNNEISANTITEIQNINSSYNGGVYGMYLQCSGSNLVSENFIAQIHVHALSNSASIFGIRNETENATYKNNIVLLGNNTATTIYGLYENASNTCNLFNNTLFVSGIPNNGNRRSFALFAASTSNSVHYQNNIFVNQRTNQGATGNHYALHLTNTTPGSIILNHNLYFVNGQGGRIANYATVDVNSLPIIANEDAFSVIADPGFLNVGGSNAVDYKPVVSKFVGNAMLGVLTDFGFALRSGSPTIGAWEFAGENMWKGNVSSDWGNPLNWTLNAIPLINSNIKFDPFPANHLMLDVDRAVNNVTISQAVHNLVLNGKRLTLNGDFLITNNAQINAKVSGSTIVFSGGLQQYLNANWLIDNEISNLRINNANNVELTGSLVLTGQLTSSLGRFDVVTQNTTVTYGGTSQQTIANATYFQNRLNSLVINNQAGVVLNSTVELLQHLSINANSLLTVSPIARLTVNGTLVNHAGTAGFILNSTASGTAAIIHHTQNVQATVRRFIGGSPKEWHFLSSPVADQHITADWKPVGSYGDGTGYDLYSWDEPAQCWVYNLNTTVAPTWSSIHPAPNFIPGRGYLYALETVNTTKQFVGNLTAGDVVMSLSAVGSGSTRGFNFLGNPYPSSIDWKNNAGFDRSLLEETNGGYTIWVWSNSAKNYGVYNSADVSDNGTNGITRYISPSMGFFVKTQTTSNFTFKNAARVLNQASNWMRVPNNLKAETLSFTIRSNENLGSDQVKLNINQDTHRDGIQKMFSPVTTAPSLYITHDDSYFSTMTVSEKANEAAISLSFKPGKAGIYTLEIEHASDSPIIVEDKVTGRLIQAHVDSVYTFKSNLNDPKNRFEIHFNNNKLTNNNQANAVVPIVVSNNLVVDLQHHASPCQVTLFEPNGTQIQKFSVQKGETKSFKLPKRGVWIVQVTTDTNTKTYKLMN